MADDCKRLTSKEWKEVENELKSLYSIVLLKVDGYDLSIVLERINQFKNGIVVYVNGQIKGEWLTKECEESRRFFRKVTKSVLSTKEKKAFTKLSKRLQKELGVDRKYSYYLADWTCFNSLKKQLISQNKSIELICKVR